MKVAGIVLAAGGSSRLGRPKQLVEIDGETLVYRTARALLEARCDDVAVVVGASADDVTAALGDLDVSIVANDAWSEGMASSIRAGIAWAQSMNASAVLISVCDQPLLTADHIFDLLSAYRSSNAIIGSRYGDAVGVPAIFPRASFADLAALRGDRGARSLLVDAQALDWPDGVRDIDTDADLAL